MAKCLNCALNAQYVIKNIGAAEQAYCDLHLPKMYNKKKLPEHVLTITEHMAVTNPEPSETPKPEAPKVIKKKVEPKVEEVVSEETAPAAE